MLPMHSLGIMLIASSLATAASAAPPNLVTNGSFEDTTMVAGSGWTTSGAFSSEGFDYSVDTDLGNAHEGSHSFAGGAVGGYGYLSQNLATTVGTSYGVRLWLANFSGFADGTGIQVRWNGADIYAAADLLGSGYTEIVVSSIATSPLTTLSIGLRDDSFFLNLDSVSVAAVPEPSTIALLIGGLGLVVSRLRRRSISA
jgi:hypothetical protein